ncbi:MAG: SusD/RagB family nutrient-binding outer membrane lipoprotein [Bacteroidota bacterium]
MKRELKIITAIAGMALILVSSCTKNFEEINTNPNTPDQAPLTNVLAYVIQNLSSRFGTTEMEYAAAFTGHVTKGNYTDVVTYSSNPSSSVWTGNYGAIATNANNIIEKAEEAGNVNMQAAAVVLKAYAMQMVTDVYGPAPYFEAGLGDEGLIHPVFDTEAEIYTDLMLQLEMANGMLSEDPLAGLLGSGDLLYGGDIMKWKRFCNSLHLRMAIRISNIDETTAGAEIARILGDPDVYPVFESNDDNAFLAYPGTEDWVEPWTARHSSIGDDKMAKPLVDTLINYGDPRLAYYADTIVGGIYVGLEVGNRWPHKDSVSNLNDLFVNNPSGSIYFLTYAEVELIKAEASARSFVTASAQDAYEAGITASCQQYGIDADTITAYLDNPGVLWEGNLEQIYIQKWISLFHQSWEAWAEMRRTDIPTLGPALNTTKTGHNRAPFRFPYPDSEIKLNGDNIPEFVVEDDYHWGYQVWWDTRTGVE